MELWIRSQNKERIIKANQLDVMEFDTDVDPRYNHFGVYANDYLVGEYKTKERALEVLNEIQDLINDIADNKMVGCIYEMPKE